VAHLLLSVGEFGEDISSGIVTSGDMFDFEGFEVFDEGCYRVVVLREHGVLDLVFAVEVSHCEFGVCFHSSFLAPTRVLD